MVQSLVAFSLAISELHLHSVATVNQIKIVHTIHSLNVVNSILAGIICIFVLGGFVFINFYRKEEGFITDIPQTEDPHKVSDCRIC